MDWSKLARRLWQSLSQDRVLLVAAGITYYLLLAIFPALAAFVMLYGVLLDPATLANHGAALRGVLPVAMADLMTGELQRLAAASQGGLGFGALGALLLALWGANGGAKAIIEGLNIAHGLQETRSFAELNLVALGYTLGLMGLILLMVALLALLPALLRLLPLGEQAKTAAAVLRWPVIAAVAWLALLLLYRWGPDRKPPPWRWLTWAAGLATAGWLAASALFSLYVGSIADFGASYGAMAAPVAVLLWLWLSMIVVLIGAEVNAETENP